MKGCKISLLSRLTGSRTIPGPLRNADSAKHAISPKAPLLTGLAVVVLLLSTTSVIAADHYVRAGATGANNGSDWTNAYSLLPATLVRGDTYFIAAGSYGSYTFDDAESGSTWIYIKKATSSAHGTETGWNSAYGTGQAIFSLWSIKTGYWDIDGVTGGGPGTSGSIRTNFFSGHGFKVSGYSSPLLDMNYFGADRIYIRHTEFDGVDRMYGVGNSNCYSSGMKAVKDEPSGTFFSAGQGVSDTTFEYIYMHDMTCPPFWTFGMNNVIVQYSGFARNGRSGTEPVPHSELWSGLGDSNVTFRWNWIEDISNTGVFAHVNGGATTGCAIYGNVITQTGISSVVAMNVMDIAGADSSSNWKFYNNTIVGWTSGNPAITFASGSGNIVQNNLWAQNPRVGAFNISGSHSYNAFYSNIHEDTGGDISSSLASGESNGQLLSSSPFVNFAGDDFKLVRATNAGTTLPNPYNVDMLGNIRGADSVWDRGAFEYQSGNPPPPPKIPNYPTNILVY